AIWDGMKPNYQGLLSGAMSPSTAAAAMQRDSVRNIEVMNREYTSSRSASVIQILGGVLLGAWIFWQRRNFVRFVQDWRSNPIAYFFALPAVIAVFAVIVFPFFYNILISFSNMSLGHFHDCQVVGL